MTERVAIVISTCGLQGMVKVFAEIGSLKEMLSAGKIFDKSKNIIEASSCSVTSKPNVYRVKINGIDSIDEAKKIVRMEFFADPQDFAKKGEILVSDLVGLTVFCVINKKKVEIGVVKEIVNYGHGSMLEVIDKNDDKKISHAYPATFDFIEKVDLKEKYLILKNHAVDIVM